MKNGISKSRLQEIAETVNSEHAKIEGALREGLARAEEVGKLLTEAKELVKHGGWLQWIADNCKFSERTAQNYMRVAERYPELAKSATVADLTYREAVGLLAEPKHTATVEEAYNASVEFFEYANERLKANDLTPQECFKIQRGAHVLYIGWAEIKVRAEREAGKCLNLLQQV